MGTLCAGPDPGNVDTAPVCTVFHDGICPLCRREVAFLRKRDRKGRIRFIDIAAPDFDPGVYGLTQSRVERQIHGLDERQEVISGVEVFRRAYAAVDLGRLWGWTGWPVIAPVCDALYSLFARFRVPLGNLIGRNDLTRMR